MNEVLVEPRLFELALPGKETGFIIIPGLPHILKAQTPYF
jgi:hypothetical protein